MLLVYGQVSPLLVGLAGLSHIVSSVGHTSAEQKQHRHNLIKNLNVHI